MNTLTDLLLGVGQPRVSHFPDLCTLLYTYLSTLDYWTKIVYYLFTQTSPVAHTSALTPTYIKSQKLPNWPISKELGLGRMLLPHWKLLFRCTKVRHLLSSCTGIQIQILYCINCHPPRRFGINQISLQLYCVYHSGLILGLHPANERHRYKVTPSLIGWAQTYNQPCHWLCWCGSMWEIPGILPKAIKKCIQKCIACDQSRCFLRRKYYLQCLPWGTVFV